MQDCKKASSLANLTYWTQTNPQAQKIASRFDSPSTSTCIE
jgi:hypothetical protein